MCLCFSFCYIAVFFDAEEAFEALFLKHHKATVIMVFLKFVFIMLAVDSNYLE